MKILFISSWFPYPPINGAKIRIYNLIRELSKSHEIVLLSFVRTLDISVAKDNIPHLEKYCKTVKVVPALSFKPALFSALKGVFSSKPISVIQTYSQQMDEFVKEAVSSESFDVVVASEVNMPYLVSLLASEISNTPKVLDAIEVALALDAYKNAKTFLLRIRNGLTWMKLKNYTRSLLLKVDACTVPSEREKKNLLEILPGYQNIKVIPHSLDLSQYSDLHESPYSNSLVYTGSFTYHANLDAAYYFLNEIYPRIKKLVPKVHLQIIGDTGDVSLDEWPVDNSVKFTGLVFDVRPLISRSWLSVVPLRVGAGTRLKIIESLALGTPVVSTSKGAEGLDVTNGKNILIADTPSDFSAAVSNVLLNSDLRKNLSQEGRNLVVDKYSSGAMGARFNLLLDNVVKSSAQTLKVNREPSESIDDIKTLGE